MRRKRSRGTWFPTFGILTGEEGLDTYATGIDGTANVNANGTIFSRIHVLTHDAPKEGDDDPDASLADIVGSEYLLRRIVGKFHVNYTSAETSTLFTKVALGFFVARAETGPEAGTAVPVGVPVGGTFSQGTLLELKATENYSPLVEQTMREPWLFRRTWILGNSNDQVTSADPGSTTGTAALAARAWEVYPPSNAGYGSVLDGPHVDAKTLRRVGQDDRLYMVVAAARWPLGGAGGQGVTDGAIFYHFDYRIFGSLRKAKQTGRF